MVSVHRTLMRWPALFLRLGNKKRAEVDNSGCGLSEVKLLSSIVFVRL
uniref:Uncharacterized protein n=1 Tax=Arundo donax TaxID=35708 RepID=A0A0A9CTZ9_ARUDO